MVLAARLSAQLGLSNDADTERLIALLHAYGLPIAIPAGLAPDALLARMRLDKKNQAAACGWCCGAASAAPKWCRRWTRRRC